MLPKSKRPRRNINRRNVRYWVAIEWIAAMSYLARDDLPSKMQAYDCVRMVAGLFRINALNVAEDVYAWRHPETAPFLKDKNRAIN